MFFYHTMFFNYKFYDHTMFFYYNKFYDHTMFFHFATGTLKISKYSNFFNYKLTNFDKIYLPSKYRLQKLNWNLGVKTLRKHAKIESSRKCGESL